MNTKLAFWVNYLKTASREEIIVLWALLMNRLNPADHADTTAEYSRSFSHGEQKRAIRRCRVVQSDAHFKGDTKTEEAYKRAGDFIRRELLQRTARGGVA